jgi:hypothetical protein
VTHQKEFRLATAAYHSALAGEREAAGRYLQRISDECGGEGLNVALIAWCDTYADHATDGALGPIRANVGFVNTKTGALGRGQSDGIPAHVHWAGRLIQARAAMDEQAWSALLDELPEDGFERWPYVRAVLDCVALTVNGLPRGFARMGRTS